jgi:hypothetical protein
LFRAKTVGGRVILERKMADRVDQDRNQTAESLFQLKQNGDHVVTCRTETKQRKVCFRLKQNGDNLSHLQARNKMAVVWLS